jgi:hypothetical protein
VGDEGGVGEFGNVEGCGDLVGFGVLDGAGPEEDVGVFVAEEGDDVRVEECVPDVVWCIVMFGGY